MSDDAVDTSPLPALTLGGSAWAIRPDVLPRLAAFQRAATTPAWAQLAARTAASAPRAARRNSGQRAGGAVAVITLSGVITPRGSFYSMLFGGGYGGLQDFREEFREALNSPDVGAIVLDVDSPGGLVDLVPETAREIRESRGDKPIIAVANTCAASAAYYIASQADELVVTPSGDVGSIGVYMLHEDWSGWNEQQGIDPTYVSAGKYKTEGNMDEPLEGEALAEWQREVDDLYAMFVNDIAAGRGITAEQVIANYGEGRCLLADRALAAGMVDRVDTIESVIGGLLLGPGSPNGAAARAGRMASAVSRARADVLPDDLDDEDEPEDEPDDDEAGDQPRCDCGKWLSPGETQCESCAAEPSEKAEDDTAVASAEERDAMASLLL